MASTRAHASPSAETEGEIPSSSDEGDGNDIRNNNNNNNFDDYRKNLSKDSSGVSRRGASPGRNQNLKDSSSSSTISSTVKDGSNSIHSSHSGHATGSSARVDPLQTPSGAGGLTTRSAHPTPVSAGDGRTLGSSTGSSTTPAASASSSRVGTKTKPTAISTASSKRTNSGDHDGFINPEVSVPSDADGSDAASAKQGSSSYPENIDGPFFRSKNLSKENTPIYGGASFVQQEHVQPAVQPAGGGGEGSDGDGGSRSKTANPEDSWVYRWWGWVIGSKGLSGSTTASFGGTNQDSTLSSGRTNQNQNQVTLRNNYSLPNNHNRNYNNLNINSDTLTFTRQNTSKMNASTGRLETLIKAEKITNERADEVRTAHRKARDEILDHCDALHTAINKRKIAFLEELDAIELKRIDTLKRHQAEILELIERSALQGEDDVRSKI
jgi:hypothetical protein